MKTLYLERGKGTKKEKMASASAAAAMVSGDVDHSYAKNSSYQMAVVDASKELINESISKILDLKILGFDTSSTVKIADLGCSVGPNTFLAVQNIIEALELKLLQAKGKIPSSSTVEFQVFFSDHYQNDFNTLFKSLPPSRKYFVAGTPGSFHGRLFPKSSLHLAHISTALHWLSRVPKEIVDRNSPAWNKGSICAGSANQEVRRAYSTQFKNDMDSFLNARAEELVPGGLMFILASVIPDYMAISDTLAGTFYDVLGACLNDLAKIGVLSDEKVDSFNLPVYRATPKEFDAIIKANGKFSIEKIEKFNHPKSSTSSTPKVMALGARAATDGVIRNHFGDEFADQIFNHFSIKVEENFPKILEKENNNIFILLKRIAN